MKRSDMPNDTGLLYIPFIAESNPLLTYKPNPFWKGIKFMDTDELLADRRKTHGSFNAHAAYTQQLKRIIDGALMNRIQLNKGPLSDTQKESLEMIVHKIGRILAGDPSFQDHWDDIAGYAKIANGVDK